MHRSRNLQSVQSNKEMENEPGTIRDIEHKKQSDTDPTATVTNSHESMVPRTMKIESEYGDEKEKRLAEFVSKMDQNRHTTGVNGFRNSQRQKAEVLFQEMLSYTRQVPFDELIDSHLVK